MSRLRGAEIVEEIDFLKSQGENHHRVLAVLSAAEVKPESLRVLLRRKGRADLAGFLFQKEPAERELPDHGDAARYNSGCRCELCRIAHAERHSKFRQAMASQEKDPNDPRHGTRSFYGNHGCRCSRCKEAHRKGIAEQYQKRISNPIAPDDHRHGTRSFYNAYGCRCAPCKESAKRTKDT